MTKILDIMPKRCITLTFNKLLQLPLNVGVKTQLFKQQFCCWCLEEEDDEETCDRTDDGEQEKL